MTLSAGTIVTLSRGGSHSLVCYTLSSTSTECLGARCKPAWSALTEADLQVDGMGTLQLSKTLYNLTEMQDVRGVLGCKAHVDRSGQVTPVRPSPHLLNPLSCPADVSDPSITADLP